MSSPTHESQSPFAEKFQALYELLTDFSTDVVQLQSQLKVVDEASRAVFSSLSRITGFSDQVQMVMALMREDMRVVEELSASANSLWPEQFEDTYRHWVSASRAATQTMN